VDFEPTDKAGIYQEGALDSTLDSDQEKFHFCSRNAFDLNPHVSFLLTT
jgi:hypothetical protein